MQVNCRRAASAAFQESVGHLAAAFPHGIDVVCAADYFSLASRTNVRLDVAVRVPVVVQLHGNRATHWPRLCKRPSCGVCLQAYLEGAPHVARFGAYRPALAQHLVTRQLAHWERPLRELASKALAALVPADPAAAAGPLLDQLLPLCLDPGLEVRRCS